jgi:uncharacterized membrane protein YeaQ/YmgE (transglycosylase-associated protein family)
VRPAVVERDSDVGLRREFFPANKIVSMFARIVTRRSGSSTPFSEPLMPDASFTQAASVWAHSLLCWIGFGTCAGLLARLVMPGRNPGGAVATLLVGIGGTCIGLGVLSYFSNGQHITPISPLGFVCASSGAAVLMLFHRMLGGYFFTEAGEGRGSRYGNGPYYGRSRRGSGTTIIEER